MGLGLQIRCESCGYTDCLYVGMGMSRFFTRPSIIGIAEEASHKEAKVLINLKNAKLTAGPTEDFYVCPSCNILSTQLYYEITYGDNMTYTKTYFCDKCKSSLIYIDNKNEDEDDEVEFSEYNCPECGKKTLVNDGIVIHWD